VKIKANINRSTRFLYKPLLDLQDGKFISTINQIIYLEEFDTRGTKKRKKTCWVTKNDGEKNVMGAGKRPETAFGVSRGQLYSSHPFFFGSVQFHIWKKQVVLNNNPNLRPAGHHWACHRYESKNMRRSD